MSWPILVVIGGFILISAAQFGGALAARKSVLWWLIYVFLLASAADPKILAPLSRFFGVQVVSNFFFATMVVFLLFQALQENASGTRLGRALRENTCTQAARDYLNAAKHFVSATVSTTARRPRVLVAFPCYNEQEALPKVVQAFHEHRASSPFEIHACFVNDASRDQSEEILEKLAPGEFTNHATNVGVSGVLLTAFKVAKRIDADFVVQCDGDGQHPVGELSRLIEEAHKGSYDLLIGSRFFNPASDALASTTRVRHLGSLIIRMILKIFATSAKITDPTSGFRVYGRNAYRILQEQLPDEYPEPESIAILSLHHARIGEISVEMNPRQGGVSTLSGLRGAGFMVKVTTALVGLRLRSLFWKRRGLPS